MRMRKGSVRLRVRRKLLRGIYPVPAILTMGNLLCGFYAIASAFQEDYAFAAGAILVAAVLDLLDGTVARMTATTSELGVQLDSLADVVSFGVAPALLAHVWAFKPVSGRLHLIVEVLPAALFVAAGAYRLARFNVQTAFLDKRFFVGLPIPAAAATVASFVLFMRTNDTFTLFDRQIASREVTALIVALGTVALAVLMVSRVRYRSLKGIDLNRAWPPSTLRWIFLLVLLLAVGLTTVPRWVLFYAFLGYAISGPIRHVYMAWRRMTGRSEDPVREVLRRAEPPGGVGPTP
jgi:CDP-diacylglycerol---serine O-phosphatidyltransferase